MQSGCLPQRKIDCDNSSQSILDYEIQKSELEKNLTVQAFRTGLLSLVLKQEEDQAIQYVLQAVVVLEDSSFLAKEAFFDFSAPLPQKSLAVGRSISHLSNLLNLNKLSLLINYLSEN